jgi:adenosylcobinamide-phosphate synthase
MSLTQKQLLAGVSLDILLGDPQWLPHPIRGLGVLIEGAETFWRGIRLPLRVSGSLFALSVVGVSAALVRFTLPRWSVYWIYSFLACRSLDTESSSVIAALQDGDLAEARQRLSFIVGRDTAHLNEQEVLRAAIETVAENLSDGVIAPLFYLALAGPAGMAAYKAINTLDSTVGYRNERYREFGWASARLDDLANFIPARLSAALICCCAPMVGGSFWSAALTTLRDGRSQPSPNAGFPEAAVAGALGVQLGGLNFYRGVPSRKVYLGNAIRPLDVGAFQSTRRLLYACTAVAVVLICVVRK